MKTVSQPARAVWIEISIVFSHFWRMVSQPARAVWIEIARVIILPHSFRVTACEGCVD